MHQAGEDVESEPAENSTSDPGQTERSGEDLNIRGVFLHVMADALGSVVVLISASVIWLTDWQYKDYLDPLLSLVIVLLVSLSSWPLLRQSVLILLNSIPGMEIQTKCFPLSPQFGELSFANRKDVPHDKDIDQTNGKNILSLFLCSEHIDAEALKAGLVSTVSAIRDVHELHIWELVGRFGFVLYFIFISTKPLEHAPFSLYVNFCQ